MWDPEGPEGVPRCVHGREAPWGLRGAPQGAPCCMEGGSVGAPRCLAGGGARDRKRQKQSDIKYQIF